MSQTISIYNFKGGVGKTTTALNLAISWSRSFKVLVIDFDPQCNLSNAITIERPKSTVYTNTRNILHDHHAELEPEEITPYLHLIPGDFQMTEMESNNQFISFGREIISRLLMGLRRDYDFIIMDCPTNFGVLVQAILGSSQNILIPSLADSFSLSGINKLMDYLGLIENQQLNILGVFFNMFNSKLIHSQQKHDEAQKIFGNIILNSTISRSVKVGEAIDIGKSIADYSPENTAAIEFMQLSDELMEKFHAQTAHYDIQRQIQMLA